MSTNATGQHRTYSKDLVQHFAGQRLAVAAVELRAPCTGMPGCCIGSVRQKQKKKDYLSAC
ncbi:MAG: hypothetical protein LZF61_04190 [Nitrosomonas sp.]|nr:MAG: hypothetical protein LZF61_04190 [Nitrosomonas sp.]